MARLLVLLPSAEVDVEAVLIYYLAEAGEPVARRFSRAFLETAQSLVEFPHKGPVAIENRPRLRDLRRIAVTGFDTVWIFYRVTPGTVDVVRVLDARRDLKNMEFE